MSCCSRMLGLEHVASRGSISIEYYGRNVGIKIMPTGVKPERFLAGFAWQDTIWRRGELLSQARHAPPMLHRGKAEHAPCVASAAKCAAARGMSALESFAAAWAGTNMSPCLWLALLVVLHPGKTTPSRCLAASVA